MPAAVTPSDASPPITKAQVSTYARAVNLRAADLPGMGITSPEGEKADPTRVGEVERCAGNVTTKWVVANIHSATFSVSGEPEHEQIRSDVEVMPSAALAKRNNASNRSQRALACARRLFPLKLASKNGPRVRYGPVTISRLPYPMPSVPGSFGYRIAVAILGCHRQSNRRNLTCTLTRSRSCRGQPKSRSSQRAFLGPYPKKRTSACSRCSTAARRRTSSD